MTSGAWERACREQLVAIDERGGTPGERLASLLAELTHGQAVKVEGALRSWARPAGRSALAKVDAARLAWVRRKLVEHGVKSSLAAHRARALCDALLGEFVRVAHGGRPSGRLPWAELVRLLTSL